MLEDSEFGDLYTDVITSFSNSPSLPVQNGVSINNDRIEKTNLTQFNGEGSDSHQELNRVELNEPARVLKIDSNVHLPNNQELVFDDPNLVDESLIDVIEEDHAGDVVIGDSVITGLAIPEVIGNGGVLGEGGGDWNESDSESDDGWRIVLNDHNAGRVCDGEGVDEGGNGGNVLVVKNEPAGGRRMEDQERRGEGGMLQGRDEDGERKGLGDSWVNVNQVVQVQPPNIGVGYNNQLHSHFEYMRPGAAPLGGLVRPPLIVGPPPGHGRGDYGPEGLRIAPPMQKGHGMPVWTNNTHGSGRGLDFTLPSHKTVFEVDIDSFEEKPWRLPGCDISDFFNFGLNEDTWKDYCKQLEQLRLEATMQSKIQVYESGRTEQDCDPDMPPELAAASGIHDISADNTKFEKAEVGHTNIAKRLMGARPQLQTGRAIQVETGHGERLPSIDTRPPRARDSDAIIEIVLQDSVDDDSVNGNDIPELPEDTSREGLRGGHDNEENNAQEDTEISDNAPEVYIDQKRGLPGRKTSLNKPIHGRKIEDGNSCDMLEAPIKNPSSTAEKNPEYTSPNQNERGKKGRTDRFPSNDHSGSASDKRRVRSQKNESAKNIEVKRSPHSSARHTRRVTNEQYLEEEDAIHGEQSDGSFELDLNTEDTHKGEYSTQYLNKQKKKLRNELSLEDVDNGEGSKAARSSENSKAISGSTSDYRNLPYGTEDEVVQDGRSTSMRIKRKVSEGDHRARGKGRDEKQDMDRHQMVTKGRQDPYYRLNWDSNPSHPTHHSHLKSVVTDQRKESDNFGGSWLRKDEELHGRTRFNDPRKRDHSDEMGPRHRSKVREIGRNDVDQYQLRKQLDNGSWREGYHDRFMGSRHWDRDDNLKFRIDNLDDLHGKRRKEDIHLRRDLGEKEELLHVRREISSRQNRERDDIMEQRKRDDIARIRNNDQHSMRHKEEIWLPRERADRQRDDWQRLKRSHEETQSKREREDVPGVKIGRTGEEKSRNSYSRVKNELIASDREYHLKDPVYDSEQHRRKDRRETESLSRHRVSVDIYSRGTRPSNYERRFRQERPSARNDRAVDVSGYQRMPEKKYEEYPRKRKESDEDYSSMVPSKMNRYDHYSQISDQVKMRVMMEQGSSDQVIPVSHQSSRKRKKDASSDDEQHELMRGRSKSERWTSHKERDVNALTKSSSLNVKDIDEHEKIGTLAANTVPDESLKTMETGQNPHSLASKRDAEDQVNKDGEVKTEDSAKLEKLSERFKLPITSEKELGAVRQMENEQLPPVQTESHTEWEIKQECPASHATGK